MIKPLKPLHAYAGSGGKRKHRQLAPAGEIEGDGILEAAATKMEAEFGRVLAFHHEDEKPVASQKAANLQDNAPQTHRNAEERAWKIQYP